MRAAALAIQFESLKLSAAAYIGNSDSFAERLERALARSYSLHSVKTRPAKVGDTLTTRRFETGTRGFCAQEDARIAVCLLPDTELSFTEEVRRQRMWPWSKGAIEH